MAWSFGSGASDRLTTPVTSGLGWTGSLIMRFYPHVAATDNTAKIFFDIRNSGDTVFGLYHGQGAAPHVWYAGWFYIGDYRVREVDATGHWAQNAWNTVALTWDQGSGVTALYTNNVLRGTYGALSLFDSTGNWEIGGQGSSSANARIADVAVFNQVLPLDALIGFHAGQSPERFKRFSGVRYWPLQYTTQDVWGGAAAATVQGAAKIASGPDLILAHRKGTSPVCKLIYSPYVINTLPRPIVVPR